MAVTVTRTAPPNIPMGFTATPDNGITKVYSEESGSLVDRTTEFTDDSTAWEFFTDQGDYIYIAGNKKLYPGYYC